MTRRYLLPILLGAAGLLLLARVLFISPAILIPADLDVIALVAFLSLATIVAIHMLVRISMSYLRQLSMQRARRETLAEHARFLRRLDHELKNPLTALRAGLKTLSLTALEEQQQQIVKTMETETVRLSRLVADLRKLAELETQPLNLQPLDLANFVTNIVQIEHDRFAAGQRSLTSSIQGGRTVWVVDEDLLALAVHNLLDNAFKYTQPNDTVHIDITVQQELTLQVIDSGAGIPPDAIPYIWEELYRAEPVEKISGSGIGLALVKAIVERHNGEVAVESAPGQGTTISLRLPPISQS
jgi:two-component system OmpR family sensor kinase